ncbi:MAG: serine--tRNA ligase [Acidimicrobiales bacterium]|jgi:seryl-tRNA synthetase
MIDIRLAREHPEEFRRALARKGAAGDFENLLEVDGLWRELTTEVDELRRRTRPKGKPTEEERAALAVVSQELRRAESKLEELERRRSELLAALPNPPDDSAPDGYSDEDALELRKVGTPPQFSFAPRDHVELTSALGASGGDGPGRPGFDLERGARVSGARFAYRRGGVALVELALYRYALDRLVAQGFEPVLPPVLVRESAMYGTGFLPTDEVNLYQVTSDGLYLTGTSEVALAALHQNETLSAGELPLRYAGYSTCFRREAGAAGRDTRGIFRVHQFDKVEMFFFARPERSREHHEEILAIEEEIVSGLGIAYRVVVTAAGDLGPSAAKKYDVEAWIPSQQRYREITSCSNTTDYQARRLNVRFRDEDGSLRFVHTLNGTAMTARFLIALLEANQDADGHVSVPEVLHPYGAPVRL